MRFFYLSQWKLMAHSTTFLPKFVFFFKFNSLFRSELVVEWIPCWLMLCCVECFANRVSWDVIAFTVWMSFNADSHLFANFIGQTFYFFSHCSLVAESTHQGYSFFFRSAKISLWLYDWAQTYFWSYIINRFYCLMGLWSTLALSKLRFDALHIWSVGLLWIIHFHCSIIT
jgi:hypothetical protein